MKLFIQKKQNGVGLIEVLIATVVIAIGLLAVASLQGGFISSSGDSKIRSEALTLAEQKTEELRNNIDLAGYNAIPNSDTAVADSANPITGNNSTFNRSWVINAGGADRKKISVTVSWDNDGNVNTINDDEKVNIVTEMTFIDPAKSALYAAISSGGTGTVPSPRQNASEDVNAASENVVGTDLSIITDGGVAGTDGNLSVDLPDEGGTLIVYQVAPNSHFYTSTSATGVDPGVIAVFLCDNGLCSHIQNHFGGVVHRVKGTVYSTSGNGLSTVLVAWTSSDVHACYVGTSSSSGDLDSMPYECVYAGNCNTTASGTRAASGNDATIPGCFLDAIVSDTQINNRNVGPGGEFGDIGLVGLVSQGTGGLNTEQICFLEDSSDPSTSPLLNTSGSEVLNENYLFAVTKRFYLTRSLERNDSINDHKSEGINRSYTNHNFFIIAKGTGANAKAQCNTILNTYQQQIAPREISRALNEGTNNIVPTESQYTGGTGTANILTGNVTSSATLLRLLIPETGTCYLNNALDRSTDATGYACIVPSDASSVEIIGSSNQHKDTDPSVFASCTKAVDGTAGCHWLTDYTNNFNDGGTVSTTCSTPWGADLANGLSVDAYATSDCSTAISLTCNSGTLDGDSSAIYETSASCTLASTNAVCSSPWVSGPDIIHGDSVTAFTTQSVEFGSDCPTGISRTCNNGTLDGDTSATYQSCTVNAATCFVPDIDGSITSNATQLASVISEIQAAGLIGVGTLDATLANSKVFNQDPAADLGVPCGSTVTFDYKQ